MSSGRTVATGIGMHGGRREDQAGPGRQSGQDDPDAGRAALANRVAERLVFFQFPRRQRRHWASNARAGDRDRPTADLASNAQVVSCRYIRCQRRAVVKGFGAFGDNCLAVYELSARMPDIGTITYGVGVSG